MSQCSTAGSASRARLAGSRRSGRPARPMRSAVSISPASVVPLSETWYCRRSVARSRSLSVVRRDHREAGETAFRGFRLPDVRHRTAPCRASLDHGAGHDQPPRRLRTGSKTHASRGRRSNTISAFKVMSGPSGKSRPNAGNVCRSSATDHTIRRFGDRDRCNQFSGTQQVARHRDDVSAMQPEALERESLVGQSHGLAGRHETDGTRGHEQFGLQHAASRHDRQQRHGGSAARPTRACSAETCPATGARSRYARRPAISASRPSRSDTEARSTGCAPHSASGS